MAQHASRSRPVEDCRNSSSEAHVNRSMDHYLIAALTVAAAVAGVAFVWVSVQAWRHLRRSDGEGEGID